VAAQISVIICSHNPRRDYLARVLVALQGQTLPFPQWELLLIDNASTEPLAGRFDLHWHPNSRHVRENELGLTPARLRGIAESKSDLLVFADDDNVLSPNYLAEALVIIESYPWIGAAGGTISGEFEVPPAEWAKPLLGRLAIRHFEYEVWSNDASHWQAQPCGAGLCIRAAIARKYRDAVLCDSARRQLDRRGSSLLSTGDTDLIVTCREVGLGWGNFPQLTLTHLIPASRLTEHYFLRLFEGMTTSEAIFAERQGFGLPAPDNARLRFKCSAINFVRRGRRAARFYLAGQRGLRTARRILAEDEGPAG
jgi:glycosyltransferase involved in cell wall biosynthesis